MSQREGSVTSEQEVRARFASVKRLVVKVGTRVLVDDGGKPLTSRLNALVKSVSELHHQGREVVLVSSGAIGCGMQALGLKQRPKNLAGLQMAAAVGQGILMSRYQALFAKHDIHVGQVLLTYDDFRSRIRYLNARNAMLGLIRQRVIPIVNENDVVSVDEIKFGDNDVLAAMSTSLIDAELLVLMSTTDGLQAPGRDGKMATVSFIENVNEKALALVFSEKNHLSSGGMRSKLVSAQTARESGAMVAIVDGRSRNVLRRLMLGKRIGTCIAGSSSGGGAKALRKKWIAFVQRAQGDIVVDDGAKIALCERNRSLLAIGIRSIGGKFEQGAVVQIKGPQGEILGRGLSEYSSEELQKICGKRSVEIASILGSCKADEVIHRDNLVILGA